VGHRVMDFILKRVVPMSAPLREAASGAMTSLIVFALLVFVGFPVDSTWAHVSTDISSLTDWH